MPSVPFNGYKFTPVSTFKSFFVFQCGIVQATQTANNLNDFYHLFIIWCMFKTLPESTTTRWFHCANHYNLIIYEKKIYIHIYIWLMYSHTHWPYFLNSCVLSISILLASLPHHTGLAKNVYLTLSVNSLATVLHPRFFYSSLLKGSLISFIWLSLKQATVSTGPNANISGLTRSQWQC